ncbi:hypothetical protein TKK_0002486 [Trichogramma kaykai]|uniref:EGF-like domain-containing protein n=1 Tax=Trichogramma kaykai TaxID=54128 RepID=A0ABD2VXC4_9HYME
MYNFDFKNLRTVYQDKTRDAFWKVLFAGLFFTALTIGGGIGLQLLSQKNSRKVVVNETLPEVIVPYTNALIIQLNHTSLWAIDILDENSTYTFVNSSKEAAHVFEFYRDKTIYFGGRDPENSITSLSKKFIEPTHPGKWNVTNFAIDDLNGKLYVLDNYVNELIIFDVESKNSTVLWSDLDSAKSIVLDPSVGLLFILKENSILRATMDGRYPKIIYSNDQEISALSIERKSKRLYFFVNGDIESIDFNGHYNRIVTKFENETNPIVSLTAYDNKLFWARDNESVYWTCIMHIGACDKFKSTSANTSIIALKAYDFSKLELPNGCLLHECEHMCIVATNGAQSCMCNTGWRLKDDEKSCERVDEYLIYLHNDVVSGKILSSNQRSFAEAMLPFKFNIDKTLNLSINFDLDTRRNSMIISDSSKIYEIKLNRTHEEPLVLDAADRPSRHIAVDWISNIYYYISTNDESLKNFIKVRRVDATYDSTGHKVLMEFDISIMPMEIVAHPNRGYVFFIESNNKNFSTQIGRIHSDGSELMHFSGDATVATKTLAIDYELDRLYWISNDEKKIYHSTLDFADIQSINITHIIDPLSIEIHKNFVYVANASSILLMDKRTGDSMEQLAPTRAQSEKIATIHDFKIFSPRTIEKDHPCAVDNGGCQVYCFALPSNEGLTKKCSCNDKEIIQDEKCYGPSVPTE